MIVPDVNVLVYAHNAGVPEHTAVRTWWEATVNGAEPVGVDWVVALGFVRLMSNSHVAARPQSPAALLGRVKAMLAAPSVRLVAPGIGHAARMLELFEQIGAGYRMVTDVHLAALCIELGATLATNDTDFSRFSGLRIVNPLEGSG